MSANTAVAATGLYAAACAATAQHKVLRLLPATNRLSACVQILLLLSGCVMQVEAGIQETISGLSEALGSVTGKLQELASTGVTAGLSKMAHCGCHGGSSSRCQNTIRMGLTNTSAMRRCHMTQGETICRATQPLPASMHMASNLRCLNVASNSTHLSTPRCASQRCVCTFACVQSPSCQRAWTSGAQSWSGLRSGWQRWLACGLHTWTSTRHSLGSCR
jgi:hypothetical protein